jgi:LmbE family N-acetylglucosaminyl deacetylase
MTNKLKLMCILAHPDDESLGTGGALAKYAAEGVETYLITATRGERGWFGDEKDDPGLAVLGQMREAELLAAAKALGIREVKFLDYVDGDVDQADPAEAVSRIVAHLRRVRPNVVITFAPEGAYGHPDHIAISQFTTAAVVAAADPSQTLSNGLAPLAPHRVSKLYYMAWPKDKWAAYQSVFGDLVMHVDGVERRSAPWPDWAITTLIDTEAYWPTVWRAVSCHKTQLSAYGRLEHLPEEHHKGLWGSQEYYRAFSLVNGGRKRENDLFEGLSVPSREHAPSSMTAD